eukprot:gene12860-15102_t
MSSAAPTKLFAEVQQGANLKPTETVDKSIPIIDNTVHIKQNDHSTLLKEVTSEHKLAHVETNDKSAPAIPSDVHIKPSVMPAVLNEIKGKASN